MLAVVTATSFYILRYDAAAVAAALKKGGTTDDDGVEDAFEVITEVRSSPLLRVAGDTCCWLAPM